MGREGEGNSKVEQTSPFTPNKHILTDNVEKKPIPVNFVEMKCVVYSCSDNSFLSSHRRRSERDQNIKPVVYKRSVKIR